MMNYSALMKRSKDPFHRSAINDLRHSISKAEVSTVSLIAIAAAASVGAGLAFFFFNKRHRVADEEQSIRDNSYPSNPRARE